MALLWLCSENHVSANKYISMSLLSLKSFNSWVFPVIDWPFQKQSVSLLFFGMKLSFVGGPDLPYLLVLFLFNVHEWVAVGRIVNCTLAGVDTEGFRVSLCDGSWQRFERGVNLLDVPLVLNGQFNESGDMLLEVDWWFNFLFVGIQDWEILWCFFPAIGTGFGTMFRNFFLFLVNGTGFGFIVAQVLLILATSAYDKPVSYLTTETLLCCVLNIPDAHCSPFWFTQYPLMYFMTCLGVMYRSGLCGWNCHLMLFERHLFILTPVWLAIYVVNVTYAIVM